MTMKLNQKSATVVTSFSQTKFSAKDARLRGSAGILSSMKATVAAFEDLQAARLPLQIQGSLQIPGSISGESGGASAATRWLVRQRKTASAETRTSANQMRRKVMKCWRVNVS